MEASTWWELRPLDVEGRLVEGVEPVVVGSLDELRREMERLIATGAGGFAFCRIERPGDVH
jgi:hypothetical protein